MTQFQLRLRAVLAMTAKLKEYNAIGDSQVSYQDQKELINLCVKDCEKSPQYYTPESWMNHAICILDESSSIYPAGTIVLNI